MPRLTALTVARLRAPAPGKRREVRDAALPGLAVRITDRGAKSWVFVYTISGRRRRFTIGDVEMREPNGETSFDLEGARARAIELRRAVKAGRDPADQRTAERQASEAAKAESSARTFAAVAAAYCDRELGRQRSAADTARYIAKLIERWGQRPIDAIAPIDVQEVVDDFVQAGATEAARKYFAIARRIFRWARARPAYRLANAPTDNLSAKELIGSRPLRSRVLSDDELRAVWRSAERIGWPFGSAVRLLMLTGLRRTEVTAASWREFDLPARLWTIPAERMKSNTAHTVPLTSDMIELLDSLPRFAGHEFLFPAVNAPAPLTGYAAYKQKLDKAVAVELGREPEAWVLHDIRRSVRTRLSGLPIPERVRELVLAHSLPGMHAVYDRHAYENEKRDALELWGARLRAIVDPPPANVVVLPVVENLSAVG